MTLQQQQQSHFLPPMYIPIPPSNLLVPNVHEFTTKPVPFAFSSTGYEQPSRVGKRQRIS